VTSLVIGVVTGAVLQVAIQLPGMRGLRLRPRLDLSHPGVRAILKLYAPVAVGLIVSNIGVIIDRNLASHTGEGSIAAMRFATTLAQFPLGLVATATSFAILPTLSRHASSVISHQSSVLGPQSSAYTATLKMGMKMVLVLIVPAAVGLAVLREPVVQLIFQRQAFDASATALTALAFLGYSPGIVFNAVDQLFIFAFYARKDTRTPVAVGIMAVFVYLAVALPLVRPLGMLGLVLANSAQWTSHALVLLWLLNRRVAGVIDADIGVFLLKVAAASAVMGVVCEAGLAVAGPLASTGPGVAALVAGEAALGGAVYAGAVVLLRVREAHQVWRMVEARIRRR
ncbi:MAG TPA: lipid II flippase MurJ, partial [Chloroflexota bacterium]